MLEFAGYVSDMRWTAVVCVMGMLGACFGHVLDMSAYALGMIGPRCRYVWARLEYVSDMMWTSVGYDVGMMCICVGNDLDLFRI